MKTKQWLKARLGERTTWNGVVAFLMVCGLISTTGQAEAVISLGLAIGGAINIVWPDKDIAKEVEKHADVIKNVTVDDVVKRMRANKL